MHVFNELSLYGVLTVKLLHASVGIGNGMPLCLPQL